MLTLSILFLLNQRRKLVVHTPYDIVYKVYEYRSSPKINNRMRWSTESKVPHYHLILCIHAAVLIYKSPSSSLHSHCASLIFIASPHFAPLGQRIFIATPHLIPSGSKIVNLILSCFWVQRYSGFRAVRIIVKSTVANTQRTPCISVS